MTGIRLFRIISFSEGVSLLLLLGIAMPLKYLYNAPEMVRITGMLHGVLFVLYAVFAAIYSYKEKWSYLTFSYLVFLSIIPFGTFYVDKKYLKDITA